jgi:hypothetical protein
VYTVRPNVSDGFQLKPDRGSINAEPRKESEFTFQVTIPNKVTKGTHVITADIEFDKWVLRQWCEAMIEISE